MGWLLTAAAIYLPQPIRKNKLTLLFKATAEAFQVEQPDTEGLAHAESLRSFAEFTSEQARNTILKGNRAEVRTALFRKAYQIGEQFRSDLQIKTVEDVMKMGRLIYKSLNIDFQGELRGNITIRRCYFSSFYSREVCRLISALDEGLMTGLCGGGALTFSHRITEGDGCCRAYLGVPRSLI